MVTCSQMQVQCTWSLKKTSSASCSNHVHECGGAFKNLVSSSSVKFIHSLFVSWNIFKKSGRIVACTSGGPPMVGWRLLAIAIHTFLCVTHPLILHAGVTPFGRMVACTSGGLHQLVATIAIHTFLCVNLSLLIQTARRSYLFHTARGIPSCHLSSFVT